MTPKLSVLVQVDLHGQHVRLSITGALTETNQRALHPLIRRARALAPDIAVIIDLTRAQGVTAPAVDLLRWETEQQESAKQGVRYLLPADPVLVDTGPDARTRKSKTQARDHRPRPWGSPSLA
ncbi:hypothetical protein [Kocuria arenosa]|uniref:hypothetical protein n=1 Tax=Kocuria arenosa TaxID=3071446 RepID=UPI0034D4F146